MTELTPDPNASRYSDRLPGEQCTLALTSVDGNLHATWTVVLRDGSSYVRQFLSITAGANDLPINRVQLVDVDLPGARIVGSVKARPSSPEISISASNIRSPTAK